ncbi:YxiG family protein [Caldibacillus thermoamylovorans]
MLVKASAQLAPRAESIGVDFVVFGKSSKNKKIAFKGVSSFYFVENSGDPRFNPVDPEEGDFELP